MISERNMWIVIIGILIVTFIIGYAFGDSISHKKIEEFKCADTILQEQAEAERDNRRLWK